MITPHFKIFHSTLAILLLSSGAPLLAATPVTKIADQGLIIENGGLKWTLAFPVPVNAAKQKGKILEKALTETGAMLKYADDGRIDVGILNGEITFKISGMPADTESLNFTMTMESSVVAEGKWQFDEKAGTFPTAQTAGQIAQGHFKSFSATPPAGTGLTFTVPAPSFQQLMDLRQFQRKEFFWQCWIPFKPGTANLAIKVSESTGGSAAATNPYPAPLTAEPKKPAPDRQSYGQAKGVPPEKKSGTRILKWKDGKQAVFLLGFDDSSPSHLNTVIPELEKRKMVGNFYINPGGNWYKGQQAKWEQAVKSPYVVIHNHTLLHNGMQTVADLEVDLQKTNEIIYALTPHLKNPRIIAFRTPGGVPWKIAKPELATLLAKYHMVDRPWLDGPPLTMKELPPILATVDTALANGGTGFVDFHGVGGDANVAPTEWFTALLDKLDQHREQIWITDTVSWFQYQDERKKSELKVIHSDDTQVRSSLTCSLDPALYDLPPTVAVEVPPSWKECRITQGNKTWQAKPASGEVFLMRSRDRKRSSSSQCKQAPGDDASVLPP